jgi:putative lipoic acid-binding regulatory protein
MMNELHAMKRKKCGRARDKHVLKAAIPNRNFSDKTANDLTRAILAFSKIKGHMAWRQSSEGRYRPGKQYTDAIGRTRIMKGQYLPGTNKGQADVCSIIKGTFCAIKVKMKDKQSPAQEQYQIIYS